MAGLRAPPGCGYARCVREGWNVVAMVFVFPGLLIGALLAMIAETAPTIAAVVIAAVLALALKYRQP
jgi:hypothetical protein